MNGKDVILIVAVPTLRLFNLWTTNKKTSKYIACDSLYDYQVEFLLLN